VDIISNPRVPKGLQENAAIALGRLGLASPEQLAPHLTAFAEDFLNSMIEVDASEEKGTAFKGFSMIVAQNPQAMEKSLKDYFISIARYEDMNLRSPIKQELHEIFQNILNVYKQMMPQFGDFISQLQPKDQQSLRQHYSI